MPPSTRWSLRRRIFVGVVGSIALLWLGSASAVFWHASRDRADTAEAIVVLGAAQYRGRPSPVLRARLDHAIGLYARGLAPVIALTGGTAEGDTESEALVSRSYLLQAGVPDSVLLLENEGRTTSQSLTRVAQMLRARDLERVILVSDPFHVFRASLVARRHGLIVLTSPTSTDALSRVARQPGYFLGETVKAPLALAFEW
jgi:uncharacterized SAM-binding protein YcdF (DUF218 family)